MTSLNLLPTRSLEDHAKAKLSSAIVVLRTLFDTHKDGRFIVAYRTDGPSDYSDGYDPDDCRVEIWDSEYQPILSSSTASGQIIEAAETIGHASHYLDLNIALDHTSAVVIPRNGICWLFASSYRLRYATVPDDASKWVCRHPLVQIMRPIIDGSDSGHDVLGAADQLHHQFPAHAQALALAQKDVR